MPKPQPPMYQPDREKEAKPLYSPPPEFPKPPREDVRGWTQPCMVLHGLHVNWRYLGMPKNGANPLYEPPESTCRLSLRFGGSTLDLWACTWAVPVVIL